MDLAKLFKPEVHPGLGGLCTIIVIPGRRAAASPEAMNTGLWNMASGLAACGSAPE